MTDSTQADASPADYQRALEAFLESNLGDLESFLAHEFGDTRRVDSDDRVQATLLYVLRHEDRFRHGGSEGFRSWLFAQARRVSLDLERHDRAQKRDIGRESKNSPTAHAQRLRDSITPSRHAARNEMIERVNAMVAHLSPAERHLVDLHYEQGLTQAEIARATGRDNVWVRRELARIVDRLRLGVGS